MVAMVNAVIKASSMSKRVFVDEVVVVYKKKDGEYAWCVESEFLADEKDIIEKFLNGKSVT
jgi:hypothetical protein